MKASLSIAFEDLRGKAGSVVVSKGRTGLVVKARKSGKDPRTAPQAAVRSYLTRAAGSYRGLTPTQVAAWKAFAQTVVKIDPISGQSYHPAANALFIGLASKFLQVAPTAAIPSSPPSAPFVGDSITVTAVAATGKVTFTASAANGSGITTELLLQKLPSQNRTPNAKGYRTKAFFSFQFVLTSDVTVGPGYYAAAYRFVKTATGQATKLVPLPVVTVALALSESPTSQSASVTHPKSRIIAKSRLKKAA